MDDNGVSAEPTGLSSQATAPKVAALRASIPNADSIPAIHLPREWMEFSIDEPTQAWLAFGEKLRREMASHQKIAAQLRKDAADNLEQADLHSERAAEFWETLNALQRAPVTFRVKER